MTRFSHGLIVGKFYPLHVGHSHLIRSALRQCDRVTVQLLGATVESVPLEVREQWLRDEHPTAHIVAGMDDAEVDFHSDAAWEEHMVVIEQLLDAPVDAVFSSDDYGQELATRLGATWVQVDEGRRVNPVSGRAIRADPAASWHELAPGVREWLTQRVVVLGAESTGTTTLAEAIAADFSTSWVPEYGREYSQVREGGLDAPWRSDEFTLIVDRQMEDERRIARSSPHPLLVCDTDVLATTVWHERYVGGPAPQLERRAAEHTPVLYVLSGDEIPFVQDGWRDGEHIRHGMQQRFREVLAAQAVPWIEVRGPVEERLAVCRPLIRAAVARGLEFAVPLELRSTPVDTLHP